MFRSSTFFAVERINAGLEHKQRLKVAEGDDSQPSASMQFRNDTSGGEPVDPYCCQLRTGFWDGAELLRIFFFLVQLRLIRQRFLALSLFSAFEIVQRPQPRPWTYAQLRFD